MAAVKPAPLAAVVAVRLGPLVAVILEEVPPALRRVRIRRHHWVLLPLAELFATEWVERC